MASQPTQDIPYWLSVSSVYISNPTGTGSILTTTVVPLPLTYWGPSIPLGEGWTYGGLSSPTPSSSTLPPITTTSASASETLTSTPLSTSSRSSTLPSRTSSASSTPAPSSNSSSRSASSTATPSRTSSIPSSPSLQAESSRGGLSPTSIIAIAIGSAVVLLLLLLCLFAFLKRRRRGRSRGRDLRIDTSVLPPGPGEEHGSLLAGRGAGGESPEMAEHESGFPSTVPASYAAVRRHDSIVQSPKNEEAGLVGAAWGRNSPSNHQGSASNSSSSNSRRTGNTSVSSRSLFYHPSRGVPPIAEDATLMTAQRGTRSPLARLGRLSWFAGNRNTRASSMVATDGGHDDMSDWVDVPPVPQRTSSADPRRRSAPQAHVSQPIMRTPELVVPHDAGLRPPPQSLLQRPISTPERRLSGQSAQTSQTGQTIFYDASTSPIVPDPEAYPSELGELPNSSSTVDGAWPTFPSGPQSPASDFGNQDRSMSPLERDVLDLPPPTGALRSVGKKPEHVAPLIPSRLSQAWEPESSDAHDVLLELPPQPLESWRRSLRRDLPTDVPAEGEDHDSEMFLREPGLGHKDSSRRLTLGQAVFVDTPRISPPHDIMSLHGDTGGGTLGSNTNSSRFSTALSFGANRGPSLVVPTPQDSLSSSSSRPPPPGQGTLSTYSSRALGPRHSMSALGGATAFAQRESTINSPGSTQGERDSLLQNFDSTLTEPSEMGELSPKKESPRKDRHVIRPVLSPPQEDAEAQEIDIGARGAPPPYSLPKSRRRPPSPLRLESATEPEFPTEALSPPPAKPWWRRR